MKVLMFGWEFPPFNSGGLGVACRGLTRALTQKEIEILFVLPRKVGIDSEKMKFVFADIPNIKVMGIDSNLYPYVTSGSYQNILSGDTVYGSTLFEEVMRYAKAAGDIARCYDFDIIHAHDWLSFLAGIEAKKVSGKPLVAHVHATEFDRSGGHGADSRVYEIEKMGVSEADRVIAVSNFTKNILKANYGVDENKVEVVHNGIDQRDFEGRATTADDLKRLKKDGKKIVLFVGRITLQKGPDKFLEAAQKVVEINKNALFVFAGSGDMMGQVIDEVAALGLSDNVLFTGFLRGDELKGVYQAADLFVMPSVSEPFGITPLESLINGTPVLVSKQSGVSEVLTHVLKTDFWDIDDMASKILAVLDHKSLRDILAENGKKQVNGITWEDAAQKCINIYNNILGGK